MIVLQLLLAVVFAVAAFIVALLRFAFAMEPSGLFERGHPLTYALIAIFLVFVVMSVPLGKQLVGDFKLNTKKQLAPYHFGKAMSFVMMACCVIYAGATVAELMNKPFEAQYFFLVVLPIIMACAYLPIAVFFATGKQKPNTPLIALIPVVVSAILLIAEYVSTTQMATPAQYGFVIVTQLVNILFLMYTAKFLSGAKCSAQLIMTSGIAIVANAMGYLAPFIFAIASHTFDASSLKCFVGIAMCVYASAISVFVRREIKTKDVVFEAPAEEKKQKDAEPKAEEVSENTEE